MKLRYMIEYTLRDRIREPRYEPIGVWVRGSGPGLDLAIEFLPGNSDAEEDAQWVSTGWWNKVSAACPTIFWPTTRALFPNIAACAAPWSKPTNSLRPNPVPVSSLAI